MMGLHQLKAIDPRAVVVHFSMVALCFALASFFLFERRTSEEPATAWPIAQLVGMGLAATIGQLCLTMAFTHGNAAKVSVVGLTQIVFTLLLEPLVLGESFDLVKLLGVPLVLAPTAWLMLRGRRAESREGISL
jgi:drug/metabolite transporter (DMT)-like permease